MAGGGIVSIPLAMKNTFIYPGLLIGLVVCAIAMWTSILIGKCWAILQQRHPEYRAHTRQVYAEIGNKAVGHWMKILVSITIDINQFGVSIIYLLLSAKSIYDAVNVFSGGKSPLDMCVIVVILAVCLLPFTMLKSPEDFWWAVLGGMVCSVGSVILIVVGSGLDYRLCSQGAWVHQKPSVIGILSALGTFVFAFGGHSSFVTIQHDMKRPFDFTKSSYLAFALVSVLYLPMGVIADLAYGNTITGSIINSIQNVYVQQSVNLMLMAHFLLTFLLVLNPFNQEMEELVHAHHHFGWQRILIRTGTMLLVLFIALSFPRFGPLLDLVGASTTLLTVLIYPVLFYLYLNATGNLKIENRVLATPEKKEIAELDASTAVVESDPSAIVVEEYPRATFREVLKHNSRPVLIVGGLVMLLGVFIGFASSASAVIDLAGLGSTAFETPCYIRWFQPREVFKGFDTYCCGRHGNLHISGMRNMSDIHDTRCKDPFKRS